ncbi:hypothetical protein [Candidatus Ichthyocystis hellenicum]|uniref:hypothetical protein n=1 Tax=Candidatus Ichthyocystis hellenicum TaxID=1561003 RepID=UPI000B83CAEF|nr:hypothetical protein [Candidatus Ichthyocystis hellenicum]
MINPCSPSLSNAYPGSPMQREEQDCKTLTPAKINSSDIIESKRAERYKDFGCVCTSLSDEIGFTKWKLKIIDEFKLIIDELLLSFANKLNDANCGYAVEKQLFLSVISGEISTRYPFKTIKSLMIAFIDKKIAKVVLSYAKEKIDNVINAGSNDCSEIEEIICKKVEETILKEDNIYELIGFISSEISTSCKEQHIEDEFRQYFDTEAMPFISFIDMYRNHLETNYGCLMEKFISIFHNIRYDKKSCISFVFDKFCGKILLSSVAKQLRDAIYTVEHDLKEALRRIPILEEGNYYYMADKKMAHNLESIILEEKIKRIFMGNVSIVIHENTITTCDRELITEIITHLKEQLWWKIGYSYRR